jgi:hypothetical protein
VSVILNLIGDSLSPYALISSTTRAIGTIIPDIVTEELNRDESVITDHPVDTGTAISDHVFDLPSQVEMRCGFSNSTAQTEGYVQAVYQEFLALRATRQPFNVTTGKRQYSNMLIRSLAVQTDASSEFALNITVGLREIIIASTQATAATSATSQSNGSVTISDASTAGMAPVATLGQKSLQSAAGAPSFSSVTAVQFNG